MSNDHVYGFNVIETLLREAPQRVVQVYLDRSRQDRRAAQLKSTLGRHGLSWQPASADRITALAQDPSHQGVVAEVRNAPVLDEKQLFLRLQNRSNPFLCVLENIQDPRNLGACLRTAEAAGVDVVVLPRHDTCGLTPVARKAAAGAAEVLAIARVSNLVRVLNRLKEEARVWVVGTEGGATQSVYDISLAGPVAMVFGSEGSGLKRLTRECCDHIVSLPMAGRIDSLNVSVAVGVGLYEARRQRGPEAGT